MGRQVGPSMTSGLDQFESEAEDALGVSAYRDMLEIDGFPRHQHSIYLYRIYI